MRGLFSFLVAVLVAAQAAAVPPFMLMMARGRAYTSSTAAVVTYAQVQKKVYASTASATSHAVVFTSTPTINYLCVWVCTSDATVATPAGLTLAKSSIGSTGTYIFYRVNGGSESATTTFVPGASDCFACVAMEFSGMATASPLDQAPTGTTYSGTTTPAFPTTGTTSQANELVVSIFSTNQNTTTVTATFTAGYTDQSGTNTTGSATNVKPFVSILKVAATGTQACQLTPSQAVTGESVIATFKITNP